MINVEKYKLTEMRHIAKRKDNIWSKRLVDTCPIKTTGKYQ